MFDIFDQLNEEEEKKEDVFTQLDQEEKSDIFSNLAVEDKAIKGDVFDQFAHDEQKVKTKQPVKLSEPSFFRGYYEYLHAPPERAKSVGEWLKKTVPDSVSRTAVGLAEFPYLATKSFTDPLIGLAEDVVTASGEEEFVEKRLAQTGKAAWDLLDGMGRFFGEPIGLYGWEKLKDKWLGDPAAAAIGALPITKGAVGRIAEVGTAPVMEFGQQASSLGKRTLQKVYDKVDVQAPFVRAGAEKTGIAAKNMQSIRISEQKRALDTAKMLKEMDLDALDGMEVTLQAGKSVHATESPKVEVVKATEAIAKHNKEAFGRLKEDGVLTHPWPESQIIRNDKTISSLEGYYETTLKRIERIKNERRAVDPAVRRGLDETAKGLENEISELGEINKTLKKQDPQYVHIPLDQWYSKIRDVMGEERGQGLINSYYKGRYFKKRKTVDIGDTIEWLKELKDDTGKPIFEPIDFDARMIMASYAQKTGVMRGLAKIFNSAKSDGLIIPKRGKAPNGYGEAPFELSMRYPELKKSYIHNAFNDYMGDYIKKIDKGADLGRIFGYTKMMAFYNPFFLPVYDLWQASWAGSLNPLKPIKSAKYFRDGFKSVLTRDQTYYDAVEAGTLSTPYTPPFENFKADMRKTVHAPLAERAIKTLAERTKNPLKLLDDFYKVVWNMAWGGDAGIRVGTYKYMKEKGFSNLDAGQTTAYFHGDYARMPASARRTLNKILFTPTFKYTMGHLQANMIKSSAAVMRDALKIQKPQARDMMLAKGMLMLTGGLMAKDYLMENWGFKTDRLGLRYVKEVDTDEGQRELVLYWPDPNNVLLRQVHKWTNWGDDPKHMDEFMNKLHWDLHPLWSLAYELTKNDTGRGGEDRYVRNPFDNPETQAWDIIHHSVSKIIAAEGFVENYVGTKDEKSAYKALRKEIGWLNEKFLSATTLAYLRKPENIRNAYKVKALERLFRKFTIEDQPKKPEEYTTRIRNFFKSIREIGIVKTGDEVEVEEKDVFDQLSNTN